MPRIGHTQITKPIWMISAVFLLIAMGNVGCSLAGDQILPAGLEERISSSNGTADDHRTAAQLYQQEAQRLAAEAAIYARKADSISQLEDTKGFRQNALKTAAQVRQKQSAEILQIVTKHQQNAESVTAQQTQQ
jgi:hypothetical protein